MRRAERFFEVLRDEEMGHLKYLRERLEEWTATGKVQVAELETVVPSREIIDAASRRSGRGWRRSGVPRDHHMTELDLLGKALRRREGDQRVLPGDGPHPRRRRPPALPERFVEIEEGHQAIVQAEIDSVSGMGVWFDTMELSLEGG